MYQRKGMNLNPKIFGSEFDDERPAVYSECPAREPKIITEIDKDCIDVSRWLDKGIRFHENSSKKNERPGELSWRWVFDQI